MAADTTVQVRHDNQATRGRRVLMLINGGFLVAVGGVQLTLELLSQFGGRGPWGTLFQDSPLTIGMVEAHAFAVLIGILFLAAATDGRRFWHVFAAAVHIMLGTANLVFWDSFATLDVVPMGVAATTAHVLLAAAHGMVLARSSWTEPGASGGTGSGPR